MIDFTKDSPCPSEAPSRTNTAGQITSLVRSLFKNAQGNLSTDAVLAARELGVP